MNNTLFITGFLRSGTTLAEKLLHAHPQLCIAEQPFPLLFVDVKEQFYIARGKTVPRYPLGHRFPSNDYTEELFHEFVNQKQLSNEDLQRILQRQKEYSGWKTPSLTSCWSQLPETTVPQFVPQAAALLSHLLQKPDATTCGFKEVFCEEYVEVLTQQNIRTLLVVRDIRDVITSSLTGRGRQFAGDDRSLIFLIRQWRKSIAWALSMRNNSNVRCVRYEDLVLDPEATLNHVTDWLGVDTWKLSLVSNGINAQDGSLWRGNSSHGNTSGINPSSIGRYKTELNVATRRFVEWLTEPELAAMNYLKPPVAAAEPERTTIENFLENADDQRLERERIEMLRGTMPPDDTYFIRAGVRDLLADHLHSP